MSELADSRWVLTFTGIASGAELGPVVAGDETERLTADPDFE
jgi:hypothetical protein